MTTVQEIFERDKRMFRRVARAPAQCRTCRIATDGFSQCWSCNKLFGTVTDRDRLIDAVVPLTFVESPSTWYERLGGYKNFQPEYRVTLAALASSFVRVHRPRIEAMLGGQPTIHTIVPSSRRLTFAEQPLAATMKKVSTRLPVEPTLRNVRGEKVPRRECLPDYMEALRDVEGHRIVLVEDLWVTGASTITAAQTLLDAGAESVVTLVMARKVDTNWFGDDSPYIKAIRQPYDLNVWPR